MTLPVKRKRNRPLSANVERARQALLKHAETAAELVVEAAKVQAKRGGHTAAAWILEHTAEVDSQGKEIRPIAAGIDRQAVDSGNRLPTINIGFITPTAPALQISSEPIPALPPREED